MSKISKKILEEQKLNYRYKGVAPEGFVLVHEKTLESLKDFDTWKDWKNDKISFTDINNIIFSNNYN